MKDIERHGLSYHSMYIRWDGIVQRCTNSNNDRYYKYGGRGITICDEWRNNFMSFYNYLMSLPNAMDDGLTIDRIKNDQGYKPGNVRWANNKTQSANHGLFVTNKTGYSGVRKRGNSYGARITVDLVDIWIGSCDSAKGAAIIRDWYIINNDLFDFNLQVLKKPAANYCECPSCSEPLTESEAEQVCDEGCPCCRTIFDVCDYVED